MPAYNHGVIEKKWQKHWSDNKTFETEVNSKKPKYYVLDMFPYVSGSGLHVGHLVGYTATDIMARYKRQSGFNVLHPMGWDSFGLPTEQHAMRTGEHPAKITKVNIANFKRQLERVGFSYDWSRELATSDSSYYKWTQWIFTKLYERGLAYEAEIPVNYCPALGTVLANEEVEDGRSKEGGHLVERRPLKQWMLKITEYADRLLEDLQDLDWPESLKNMQRNWIGRSEGLTMHFLVEGQKETIEVFTTRPGTLFGATFIVLSPEHPLVDQITHHERREQVKDYRKQASLKSDLDRTELNKDKDGVFAGAYAYNPATKKQIPVWIADYVLASYGTGAVMAVPGHDTRDFDFAKKYSLEIITVVLPEGQEKEKMCWTGEGIAINSQNDEISLNGMGVDQAINTMSDWIVQKKWGKKQVMYKLRDWLFSRQRYWGEPFPILHFADGSKRSLTLDELPLCPPLLEDFKPAGDGKSPLSKAKEWVEFFDPKTAKNALRETNTMPQWAGSCWYYIRFCDPLNEQKMVSEQAENYWLPVDLYVGGAEHAVLHLLYARFWHKVLFDMGVVSTKEPFQSLRNQGLIVATSYKDHKNCYVETKDVRKEGDKYIHKQTGEKLHHQIEKMSKSKLNGVTPDEIIEEYGADALRIYEMFMSPLDKEKLWTSEAVNGAYRFLCRLYSIVTSDKVSDKREEQAWTLGYKMMAGVRKDIESELFNTAIAKMMEFLNAFSKLESYPKAVLKMVVQALYPFAPHICCEMWELLGETSSLDIEPLIQIDPSYLVEENALYAIQVNGKLRAKIACAKDLTEAQVRALAEENSIFKSHIEGKEIKKTIFVQNRLLNVVVA
jgi:leucyl-tRNA synthetase